MKIVGYHGTCLSAAENIVANGFRTNGPNQMAGPGAYLWAGGGGLRAKAMLLAETWYAQQDEKGAYALAPNPRMAIVRFEADVPTENYLDLEMMVNRERIASFNQLATAQGNPHKDAPALYGAYIAKVRKDRGTADPALPPVFAVRLTLPPPDPYRSHPGRALGLTAGVDAYIMLRQAGGKVFPGSVSIVYP